LELGNLGVPLHPKSFIQLYYLQNSMYLDSAKKKEIFAKHGKSNTDTGSPEAQIALFSYRISHLTEHLKSNKKDYSTERALKILVGKRRRLLDYLIDTDIERYRSIIKELGIRK
jgi:small subunit ribosomal protein S15